MVLVPLGGAVDILHPVTVLEVMTQVLQNASANCLGQRFSNRVLGAPGYQWVPLRTSQRKDIQGGEGKARSLGKAIDLSLGLD